MYLAPSWCGQFSHYVEQSSCCCCCCWWWCYKSSLLSLL